MFCKYQSDNMKEFYISDACLPLTVALGYREQYTISSFKFDEIVPLNTLIRQKKII